MKKFSNKILLLIMVFLCIIFEFILMIPTTVFASQPITININGHDLEMSQKPILRDGRVLVPLRAFAEGLDLEVDWDSKSKIITIIRKEAQIKLIIGEYMAKVNQGQLGILYNLELPPQIFDKTTYVPVRRISELLDVTVDWNQDTQTVSVIDAPKLLKCSILQEEYWLDKENGDLYIKESNSIPVKIGRIDLKIKDHATMEAIPLTKKSILLTVIDNYGEPHINKDVSMIFIKDNQILHFTTVHYWKRFEENVKIYKNNVVMTDGQKVYLVDNESGDIEKIYVLAELTGEEKKENDNWFIEEIGENYLLVRRNHNGILTFIDTQTKEKAQLYKQFFAQEELRQAHAETNDVPYYGDYLHFVNEKDNVLYFKDDNPCFKNDTIYKFLLKK